MYRVFMVDDEPWALIGLSEILDWESLGFRITAKCESARKALEVAEKEKPDVLITDIRMPEMTGLELIEKMKNKYPELICLIVSAYSDFEVAREAIRLSAVDYILKPLDAKEVRDAAEKIKEKLVLRDNDTLSEPVVLSKEKHILPPEVLHDGINYLVIGDEIEPLVDYSLIKYEDYSAIVVSDPGIYMQKKYGISQGFIKNDVPEDVFEYAIASFCGNFRYASEIYGEKGNVSVTAIQKYLWDNLNHEITLSELATHFFITETYLCDVFKKKTGSTVLGFLKSIRIENAARLLRTTNLTLSQISEACGYNDYSYFGKHFKNILKMTPEDYRKKSRK